MIRFKKGEAKWRKFLRDMKNGTSEPIWIGHRGSVRSTASELKWEKISKWSLCSNSKKGYFTVTKKDYDDN